MVIWHWREIGYNVHVPDRFSITPPSSLSLAPSADDTQRKMMQMGKMVVGVCAFVCAMIAAVNG